MEYNEYHGRSSKKRRKKSGLITLILIPIAITAVVFMIVNLVKFENAKYDKAEFISKLETASENAANAEEEYNIKVSDREKLKNDTEELDNELIVLEAQ